jgi:5,10-methenyltetrahydromethanopterin hydrogenase
VIGVVLGWRARRAITVALLLPVVSTLVTAIVFYGLIRFRDADAPLYVVPAALALSRLLPARSVPAPKP